MRLHALWMQRLRANLFKVAGFAIPVSSVGKHARGQ